MSKTSQAQRIQASWPAPIPTWVMLLAEACDSTSQVKAAKELKYSPAVVNQVLANTYKGDLRAVQRAVEGAFANVQVECPVLGTIKANRCVSEQRKPLQTVSAQRIRLHRACRSGCSFFRGSKDE